MGNRTAHPVAVRIVLVSDQRIHRIRMKLHAQALHDSMDLTGRAPTSPYGDMSDAGVVATLVLPTTRALYLPEDSQ